MVDLCDLVALTEENTYEICSSTSKEKELRERTVEWRHRLHRHRPPAFTLTINGTGITNNSGATQNFVSAVDAGGKLRKDII